MARCCAARPVAVPWRVVAAAAAAGNNCSRLLATKTNKKNKGAVAVTKEGQSSNVAVKGMPPLGPRGSGDMPIDDYGREGKRTPQQLLVESTVAKNYSRLKMQQNKSLHSDLNRRLRLMHAAIDALPLELQAEARTPDMSDFPVHRPIPGHAIHVEFIDDE